MWCIVLCVLRTFCSATLILLMYKPERLVLVFVLVYVEAVVWSGVVCSAVVCCSSPYLPFSTYSYSYPHLLLPPLVPSSSSFSLSPSFHLSVNLRSFSLPPSLPPSLPLLSFLLTFFISLCLCSLPVCILFFIPYTFDRPDIISPNLIHSFTFLHTEYGWILQM